MASRKLKRRGAAVVLLAGLATPVSAPAAEATPNVTPEVYTFPAVQAAGSQSAPVAFELRVTCYPDAANPPNGCLMNDTYTPSIRTDSPVFVVTGHNCPMTMTGTTTPFGVTCTINVAFAPSAPGTFNGTLLTGTNPPDPDPEFAVAFLQGTSQQATPNFPITTPIAGPFTNARPDVKKKCKKPRKRGAAAKKCNRKKPKKG